MRDRNVHLQRLRTALVLVLAVFGAAALLVQGGTTSYGASSETTLWSSQVPAHPAAVDAAKVELGTRFSPRSSGSVTKLRIYRASANTGPHVATLWSASGRTLAKVTLPTSPAAGWVSAPLAKPVTLTAGSTYVVSYLAPRGHYAADPGVFAFGRRVQTADLTATAGVYRYGGGFPTSVWQGASYYVDVVFQRLTAGGAQISSPPVPTNPPAAPNPSPTPTNPPSSTGSFPSASTTGSHGSLTQVRAGDSGPGWSANQYGDVTITGNGTVFSGYTVAGSINVQADDVVVRNAASTASGDSLGGIALRHADNAVIQDVTVGPSTSAPRLLVCAKDVYGDSANPTFQRVNFFGCSTGIQIDRGLIVDSYIHDLRLASGDHVNGTTSNAGTDQLTIRHNTILNQFSQTDAVSLFQDFGVQRNRLIEDNLLAGGGYAVYGGEGDKGQTQNIKIRNNRFSTRYYAGSGSYGPLAHFTVSDPGNEWSGNVWADGPSAGRAI